MVRVIPFGKLLACGQALLFGRAKRVSRERAPRARVLARLALLSQIGELARRLGNFGKYRLCFEVMKFFYSF